MGDTSIWAAMAALTVPSHILQPNGAPGLDASLRPEALYRPGQLKMKACTSLGRYQLLPGQSLANVHDMVGLGDSIGNGPAAIRRGQVETVSHRAPPVGASLDASQTVLDAHQATHVARVAVRVPTAGVHDHQRLLKVVVAV